MGGVCSVVISSSLAIIIVFQYVESATCISGKIGDLCFRLITYPECFSVGLANEIPYYKSQREKEREKTHTHTTLPQQQRKGSLAYKH